MVKVISESLALDMSLDIGYIIRFVLVGHRLHEFWGYWKGSCIGSLGLGVF